MCAAVVAFLGYRELAPNPKNTVVSGRPVKVGERAFPSGAVKKLSDEEKRRVGAYLVRRRMAEVFGGARAGRPEADQSGVTKFAEIVTDTADLLV